MKRHRQRHGFGHKQIDQATGEPRFPFNPGPAKGKFPGIRHTRAKRVRRADLSQAVAASLTAKMATAFQRFRRPA